MQWRRSSRWRRRLADRCRVRLLAGVRPRVLECCHARLVRCSTVGSRVRRPRGEALWAGGPTDCGSLRRGSSQGTCSPPHLSCTAWSSHRPLIASTEVDGASARDPWVLPLLPPLVGPTPGTNNICAPLVCASHVLENPNPTTPRCEFRRATRAALQLDRSRHPAACCTSSMHDDCSHHLARARDASSRHDDRSHHFA